jgi:hypothetical protein
MQCVFRETFEAIPGAVAQVFGGEGYATATTDRTLRAPGSPVCLPVLPTGCATERYIDAGFALIHELLRR